MIFEALTTGDLVWTRNRESDRVSRVDSYSLTLQVAQGAIAV